ncbi:hypothetical protein E2542_SST15735 [Spatholobus suberectus]|nr:hypothetical protein E2542_SST15735 [Spatholobus suberectus]
MQASCYCSSFYSGLHILVLPKASLIGNPNEEDSFKGPLSLCKKGTDNTSLLAVYPSKYIMVLLVNPSDFIVNSRALARTGPEARRQGRRIVFSGSGSPVPTISPERREETRKSTRRFGTLKTQKKYGVSFFQF